MTNASGKTPSSNNVGANSIHDSIVRKSRGGAPSGCPTDSKATRIEVSPRPRWSLGVTVRVEKRRDGAAGRAAQLCSLAAQRARPRMHKLAGRLLGVGVRAWPRATLVDAPP